MNESFEREFYWSRWQRVLPVGPYGVQPTSTPGAARARPPQVRSCVASGRSARA
jgi:hypothetical protein